MFANFFEHFRRADRDYERAFVKDVVVERKIPRNRAVERLLIVGWILIGLKCWAIWWACSHYAVPIHPGWIVSPTIFMAALCTLIYWRR